jgi:PKD domain
VRRSIQRRGGRSGTGPLGLAAAAILLGLAALASTAATASAAPMSQTSPTTLTGSRTLSSLGVTATGAGVTATFDLDTTLDWSQAASIGAAWDSNLVRQGRSVDVADSYARTGPGSMTLSWTMSNLEVSWDGVGPLSLGSPGFSASGTCDLQASGSNYVCNLSSSQVALADPYPVPGPYVKLGLAAQVTITPHELATMRQAAFGGNADGTAGLSLGESPISDTLAIPCTVAAGDELSYSLGSVSGTEGLDVLTSLVFEVGAELPNPLPPFNEIDVPFASPTVPLESTTSDITMSGDGATFDLGSVQANNVPPTTDAGGPYSGDEGSPVSFDGSGSSSICGAPTLRWDYSDGGVAFGQHPQHTFADDGVYSGLLTATDATGLSSTKTFSVTVANVAPSVDAGPDTSSLWGVPVAFNGQATDPGSADQSTLDYTWSFGDGSPSAGGGPNVSHAYALPGDYTAPLTVCDKDGGCSSSDRHVVVSARATSAAYSGPVLSTPSKVVTLSGSLTDELGQPVVGRTVAFTLGTQSATAVTNGSGVASTSFKLNQKHGDYTVSIGFAGDPKYEASSSSTSFTIGSK